jgi:hypothetical protein
MKTITLESTTNQAFINVFTALLEKDTNLQAAMTLATINSIINEKFAGYIELQNNMLEEHGEDGELDEEASKLVQQELQMKLKEEFEIPELNINALADIKISANDLVVLHNTILAQPTKS